MAKALKIAAVVVGVAALAVVTGGAALGLGISLATTAFGVSAGTLLLASTALSLGSALLTKKPSVTAAQTERLFASVDPRAFRKTPLGQTAFPIDIGYEEWSGKDQEYCDWIVRFASCAIDGLDEIWFNNEMAWSVQTGVVGKYVGYFSVPNIVLEGGPDTAFTFGSGKWNAFSARLTGCAYARFRFKVTGNGKKAESPFASGLPSRITAIGRGAKLYDPRRDSTVPGGSGPMRVDDQSTWRFTADDGAVIGENLPLQILRVVLGWRIRNPVTGEMRLATGSGVPGRRLRLASWIDAANLADELVNRSAGGQEPRYHGAAVVSEGDEPRTTLDMLSAGCCGRFRDTGGKLSFEIMHNDLAAAATDDGLFDDDVIGGFTWDPDPGLEATPNVVRGRYVDASINSLYQLIDYPEVRIPAADGQDRIYTLDLGAVESPSQAQRVVKQGLQRKQYQRRFSAPFDIRAWKYPVGSVVPFTFAPLGFRRVLFRVEAQELSQGGVCNMTLTAEHASIYAFDADDRLPVQAAEPIVYDSRNNPLIVAIAEAGTTAEWQGVTGPGRPTDNADVTGENTSKDTTAVGGRPANELLARVDEINDVAIPAVNLAVATANQRIDAARQEADQAAADANARIDAADLALDDAVRDFAAEVDRAKGADEALSRRIDSIVAESGGYDDRDIRAIIANEQLVRADDDRALAREIDTVSASVKDGDDAVRADVKVTTDALARSDEAFAQRAETIEAILGTVDSRIAAKAEEVTTAYVDADRALTRRIDSIVAEGGYDDRDVRAEIKRVDDTAIERDGAVARRVDTVEATFSPGGGNMVPNSDLVTTDGWSTGIHAPGGPLNAPPLFGLNAAGDPYHPVGENVLSILQFGPPNGGDGSAYLEWASSTFPVTAGDYLQFSALVNCHRAPVTLFLAFRDAAGGYLTAIPSPVVGPVENLGNRLSYYARAGVVSARVPDGAISAYLILRKLDTIKDHTDSYAWFLRPYVGAVREGQTAWNPYSVGRNSPVMLGTVARVKDTTDALARADAAFAERAQSIEASLGTVDTRITAKATDLTRAFTDGDTALATRAATLEAAASSVSTSIVFNDNFNFWPDGATLPARWFLWSTSGNFRINRLAPGRGGGQYCVQTLNDVAEVDSGFFQTIYTAGAGKWVIEVTAGFDTSGARGAGVTLHGIWNLDFCSEPDINGVVGDRPGETRSWTKMVDLDGRDQINVHAMHGWSGFGRGMAAKYMVWHRLALRPATDGEIKAGKADATLNGPGGVLARIKTSEDTLADLPNRYAAASRTATLEAQLRGEAASGLGNTIGAVNGRIDETSNILSARIEDRATAIADAKAGAVAQTVQTLRSEYNGTAATVAQQAAALVAADGRTSVYWEVVGTTGDGSTRVRLSKSDGQRGVFYVDADMIIDGSLLVKDSIITDKIANQAVTTPVAVTAGLTTASNGETKVAASAAFTASGIGFTRIDLQYDQRVNAQGTTGTARAFLRRTQNGVETTVSRAVGIQPQSSLGEPAGFLVIDYPAAGPVTYDLVISTDSGNRIFALLNIALIIAEIKK